MNGNPRPSRLIQKITLSKSSTLISLWCTAAALESFFAVVLMVSIPRDPNNAFMLGLSTSRWILLVGLLGSLILFGFMAYNLWRNNNMGDWFLTFLTATAVRKTSFIFVVVISFFGFIVISQLFHLANVVVDPFVQGYLTRLKPYMFLVVALCIQTLLLFPLLRYGTPKWGEIFGRKILRYWFFSCLIVLVICLLITLTGIGLTPDKIGWDAPGVPILPYQVGLIMCLGGVFLLLTTGLLKNNNLNRKWQYIDILISLLLWVSAVGLWSREPLVPAFFNPEPRAPNYEYYPHSDAALHDSTAQFLMIGDGFKGVARKPLYALFLALLHGIAGQSYTKVVGIQLAVIGLFPVLLYWLGSKIHHRVSGLVAAGLIILRELNGLKLAGIIGVSNSKMLMSDLPATVFIVMISCLLVLWMRDPSKHHLLPMGIGGSLGLLMLLRPQSTFLIPAVFLLILLVFVKRPLVGLGALGLTAIGLILTLTPWLWRSYTITGKFSLNDPGQMAFLTQQYHLDPGTEIMRKNPGESEADFIQRVNDYLKEFVLEFPVVVAGFITSHFTHNHVGIIQTLPMSFWITQNPDSDLFPYWRSQGEKLWNECCSATAYVDQLGYWDPKRESIQTNQLPPMVVNLLIVSLGFGVLWHQKNITGWVPLVVGLVYSLSTAVGRYSGWRLILPADWVIFLYFAMGLGQVSIWLYAYFTGGRSPGISSVNSSDTYNDTNAFQYGSKFPAFKGISLGAVFLVLGFVPTIVEAAVPKRYSTIPEMELMAMASVFDRSAAQNFLSEDKAIVLQGRAMYPRFFKAGEGEPGNGWEAFSEREFPRLGFILLSDSKKYNILMPMSSSPNFFPNASDVIVIGCQEEEIIDSAVIAFKNEPIEPIIRSTLQGLSCPLP